MPDHDIERRIVTGLIVSAEYARWASLFWSDDLIESPELRRVARWALDYLAKYKRPPDHDIEAIYCDKRDSGELSKAEAELIARALDTISREFGRGEDFSVGYLRDRTVRHLRGREIALHAEALQDSVERGDVEDADAAVRAFKPRGYATSRGIELGSHDGLRRMAKAFDRVRQPVVRYPGALGEMLNDHLVRDAFVALLAPVKRGKCLSGNQRVLLSTGEVLPLLDVIKQERRDVVSYNEETDRFVNAEVTDFYRNGRKPVWAVRTKSGRRVEVTGKHPFLTPSGWVELRHLGLGEFVAVPKHIPVFGRVEIPDEQVKLLGYFIADGGLGCDRYVRFTKGEDAIKKDFETCVEAMGCCVKWDGIDGSVINSIENRYKHNKNYVRDFLSDNGLMGCHSYNKKIPDQVYQFTRSKLSLFLSTLITCDGWVTEGDGNIGFSVANEFLARQVHELLSRFGIVSGLHFSKNEKRGAWCVSIRDYENIVRFGEQIGFMFSKREKFDRIVASLKPAYRSFLDKFPNVIARRFYDEIEVEFGVAGCRRDRWSSLWREFCIAFPKAAVVRDQIAKPTTLLRQMFFDVRETEAGKKYMDSSIIWDEIIDISYVGVQETYDLTVAEHHNFVAENIIVHNTAMLVDLSIRAVRGRSNVAFFQAGDLTEDQLLARVGIYLARTSDQERYCAPRWRPVGDCARNQFDCCRRDDRNCDHGIFDEPFDSFKERRAEFECVEALTEAARSFPDYRTCKSKTCTERRPTVWLERVDEVAPLTGRRAMRLTHRFFENSRRRFKLATYPSGTLTCEEIAGSLDEWERQDDFVPDVIVVDYADLMTARVQEFRHRQDAIWRGLRGISQERHALVVTATQSDAGGLKQSRLNQSNFSEDLRKLAHVTAMFGLNQDPAGREKALGIVRVNPIVAREGAFSVSDEVVVLQDLAAGRAFLESYRR